MVSSKAAQNTPLASNTYVCGVHFPEGRPDEEHAAPCVFLGKPVLRKRRTKISSSAAHGNDSGVYSSSRKSMADQSEEGENISAEEARGLSSRSLQAMVDDTVKKHLESKALRIKELEQQNHCLENLLEDARAKVDSISFSLTKLKRYPDHFHFYTAVSPQAFNDIIHLVGPAANTMVYGKGKSADEAG